MGYLRKDGGYDLRTKQGRQAKSQEEAMAIWGRVFRELFKLIFIVLSLPFKLIKRIFS